MRSGLQIALASLILLLHPIWAGAACRNINVVQRVAASGVVKIEWFGHSFFMISSSRGTKVITDPFGPMGFPLPDVSAHVVTVGREHGNHNNVGLVKGSPKLLRGLIGGGLQWNSINMAIRDVLIYNVPVHQRGVPRHLKGSSFLFEMDGLCILHTGDVADVFNDDQLQLIGKVDIMLVPIGGVYTAGPEEAKGIIQQLKPKIVVPMHYWYNTNVLERFIDGPHRVTFLNGNSFEVSKETLPASTEILVPTVPRE